MSLEILRSVAKLNLCERCFQIYLTLIEPTAKEFLLVPLSDWGEIESNISWMALKSKGVFKKEKTLVLELDEDESGEGLSEVVDVEALREIQKMGVMKKASYLHKQGILKASSFKLLIKLSKIRNKLHKYAYRFTEKEFELFSHAKPLFTSLGFAVLWTRDQNRLNQIIEGVDKQAEKLISQIEESRQDLLRGAP